MFTRVVEITSKPGKAREVSRTLNDKVLAILRNQPGFEDEILLISAQNPDQLLALSFWKTKEDADRYNREQFSQVTSLIQNFIQGSPNVRPFNVDQSTIPKIVAGKAA